MSAEGAQRGITWTIRIVYTLAALFLIYLYIPIVLVLLPWTEPLARPFVGYFTGPLSQIWEAIVSYMPALLNILIIIFCSWLILKLLRLLFVAFQAGYITFPGFYEEWAVPTYKIIRFLVLALTLVMIFPLLPGSDSPTFTGVSLFVGAMVTFGSTSVMGNVTAGIILIYTRSFSVGGYVKIGATFGKVVERTVLATRLLTSKHENVTISNSAVLSSQIINYSTTEDSRDLVVHITVGIGYDVDWRKVHKLLKKAAKSTAHIESKPEPFVLQKSLDDFSVSYELNAHTIRPDQLPSIYSDLIQNVLDEFRQAEIEIMSPRYTSIRDGNALTLPKNQT